MRNKFVTFRASEKEIRQIATLAKKAKMSKTEFMRHAIFHKEIVVLDGLKDVQGELKRIGNNLNQLTVKTNMGKLHAVNLEETKFEIAKIHERVAVLCEARNGGVLPQFREDEAEIMMENPPLSAPVEAKKPEPNTLEPSGQDHQKLDPEEIYRGYLHANPSTPEDTIREMHKPLPVQERPSTRFFGQYFNKAKGGDDPSQR